MKRYLPAFMIVLSVYFGGYLLCAFLLSQWEGEAADLNRIHDQRKRLTEQVHVLENEIRKEKEQLLPYQMFEQAWSPFLTTMRLDKVLEVLDDMTMNYGLGVSRKGTAQRQDTARILSGERIQTVHLNVTGEYMRAFQFLHDLSFKMPLLRVDNLRIRSAGTGRIDVGLHFSFPEL